MEGFDGGLSSVELRSYRDSVEFAGANKVCISWGITTLAKSEALEVITNDKVFRVRGILIVR
tara:strand:- start:3543 stop:3728 length:186 start_codon:yes stop_codon:yes gene_type:complete